MEVFRAMYEVGLEREEGLLSGFTAEEREAYLALIAILTDNARQMLESEGALG